MLAITASDDAEMVTLIVTNEYSTTTSTKRMIPPCIGTMILSGLVSEGKPPLSGPSGTQRLCREETLDEPLALLFMLHRAYKLESLCRGPVVQERGACKGQGGQ